MFKLAKNEFIKLLHKKSFYIITIILVLYTILVNVIYLNINDLTIYEEPIDIQELKNENNTLDLFKEEDLETYINNISTIETEELKDKYPTDTQKYLIDNYLYNVIYELNYATYHDLDTYSLLDTKNLYLTRVENSDYGSFLQEEINDLKNITTTDKLSSEKINYHIKLKEYRINNKVDYDNDNYLNNALNFIETNLNEYLNLKNMDNLSASEKETLEYFEENMQKNEYILKNKVDANNVSLRVVLSEFANEFGLFILVYVIMISGSIISEEYNKGTIKNLLIKPFKRSTILTSKLLTIILSIPLIIIMMLLIEVIIGGIFFGFSSLSIPILIYDSAKNILITSNVFAYTLKYLLSMLPFYYVLAIFAFMLSTITASTSASVTLSFLLYLVGNFVSELVHAYNIKPLKAFVSIHWDFSYLVTHTTNSFNIKAWVSILVVLAYIIVMLIISYIIFGKKDVKNI